MQTKLLVALTALAVANDNHWTQDGAPRLDTVKMLAGDPSITREQINAAAPGFSRTNPVVPGAVQTPPAAANSGQAANGTGGDPSTTAPAIAAPASGTQAAAVVAQQGESHGQVDAQTQTGGEGEGDGEVDERAAQIAELEAELASAQARLAEGERAKVSFMAALEEARGDVDKLIEKLESVRGKETAGDAIRGYLQRQQQELRERGERILAVRRSGVDLKELSQSITGAPIDQAMARKTARGGMRPPTIVPKA